MGTERRRQLLSQNTGVDTHSIQWPQTILSLHLVGIKLFLFSMLNQLPQCIINLGYFFVLIQHLVSFFF